MASDADITHCLSACACSGWSTQLTATERYRIVMARFLLAMTRFRSVMQYILRRLRIAYSHTTECWLIREKYCSYVQRKICQWKSRSQRCKRRSDFSLSNVLSAKNRVLNCRVYNCLLSLQKDFMRALNQFTSITTSTSIANHQTIHLTTDVRSKKGSYSSLKMACHYIM